MADGKTVIGRNNIDDYLRTVANRGRTATQRLQAAQSLNEYSKISKTSRTDFLREANASTALARSNSLGQGLSRLKFSRGQIRAFNSHGGNKTRLARSASKSGERAAISILGKSGARTFGKVAGPIAIVVLTGWQINGCYDECGKLDEAFRRGEISRQRLTREKNLSIGRTSGSVAGGLGGAAGGAYLGVTVGAPFFGVGAILGGAVGGILGGLFGDIGGGMAGEAVANKLSPGESEAQASDYARLRNSVEQWFLATPFPAFITEN
jgi:hypothetical protein